MNAQSKVVSDILSPGKLLVRKSNALLNANEE